MMRIILMLLICSLGFIADAQTKEYPFFYKLDLGNQPSSCYIEYDTACSQELANWCKTARILDAKDTLLPEFPNVELKTTIIVFDKQLNPMPFVRVKFVNEKCDTLIRVSNHDGVLKDCENVIFSKISIYLMQYSPISKYVSIHFDYAGRPLLPKKVTFILGKTFDGVIPIVESKRPLSEIELLEIINDVSNGIRELRLEKEKVINLSFEI
jgi:hypothetical protein